MKGNYIGKKPVGYGQISLGKPGMWEIYDQGQFTRDSQWTGLPWEVDNAFYDNKFFTVGLADTTPHGLTFKTDGTKFYWVDATTRLIHQFSVGTAWNLDTVSYDNKTFNTVTQDITPLDLFFKPDGTKFYIVGNQNDTVYQYSCSTAWDVSTASYDSKSFSVGTQENNPGGVFFKDDGTKFYIIGSTSDAVYQYSCSTAWDISTASYDSVSFSVATQEANSSAVFFKDDGTKFYIVGTTGDTVFQYSCSTAWDISTASYDSKSFFVGWGEGTCRGLTFSSDGLNLYFVGETTDRAYQCTLTTAWDVSTARGKSGQFSIQAQENSPQDVFFKSDGTKFYIVGNTNDTVYQYSCSTAWNVSTASYDSKSFSVGTQDASPLGLFFKSDGTKFYILGSTNDNVYQYSCSTAWDVSTASYDSKLFYVGGQESGPQGLFFKDDGTKFYIVGSVNDTVYQYSCSTAWDISTASYDSKSFSIAAQETAPGGVFFKDDGTKFYIVGTINDTVYQYSCSTAWDISTASYDSKSFSVTAQELAPTGVFFKPDGAKFYILGTNADAVLSYSLPLAWDVLNAGFDAVNLKVNLQDASPLGITFKPDGTRFYIAGDTTPDSVYQYNCSNPWDVTTATFNRTASGAYSRFPVTAQEASPRGIVFKSDGTKFYIVGTTNDTVYQYSCSTAWDVSTASYDSVSFSVATEDTFPNGLFFKDDGTKFYVVGAINDTVYQYSCSTAWDISTASYDSKSFSIAAQETGPTGLFFKDDGTKFYIVGTVNDAVYQYPCSTAWDVSTASYDSKSFNVNAQEGTPHEVVFGYYGTLFYIVGTSSVPPRVYQYRAS